jgi:hypothetical protein
VLDARSGSSVKCRLTSVVCKKRKDLQAIRDRGTEPQPNLVRHLKVKQRDLHSLPSRQERYRNKGDANDDRSVEIVNAVSVSRRELFEGEFRRVDRLDFASEKKI